MANESLRLKIELLSQLLPVQYDCLEKCLLSGLQPTANRGGMLGPLLTRHAPLALAMVLLSGAPESGGGQQGVGLMCVMLYGICTELPNGWI